MKVEVLLLFFVGRLSGLGGEDFCGETTSSILNDHVLVGHVITSLVTRGIFSCVHRCLSLPSCSSFNYQTSVGKDGVCELNGQNGGDEHSNVTGKQGFAFGQIRRKDVRIITIVIDITCNESHLPWVSFHLREFFTRKRCEILFHLSHQEKIT